MKHIHKQIGPNAIATFSGEPSPELLDVVTRMVEIANNNLSKLVINKVEPCDKCGESPGTHEGL